MFRFSVDNAMDFHCTAVVLVTLNKASSWSVRMAIENFKVSEESVNVCHVSLLPMTDITPFFLRDLFSSDI